MPNFVDNNYENYGFSIKFAPNLDNKKVYSLCLKTSELKKA